MTEPSRRDFLKLATSTLLTVSGLIGMAGFFKFLDHQTEPPRTSDFDLGPVSQFPPGSRTILHEVPALPRHDAAGFSALSLVCTHLGCTVEPEAGDFICPCHASRYDPDGEVLKGPANEPLRRLRVDVTPDDRLILHLD